MKKISKDFSNISITVELHRYLRLGHLYYDHGDKQKVFKQKIHFGYLDLTSILHVV